MNHMFHQGQMTVVQGCATKVPLIDYDEDCWGAVAASGTDAVTQVPLARWDHSWLYMPYEQNKEPWFFGKTYCNHCALMEGVDLFDPRLFGMSIAEGGAIDPHQRLTLECGYASMNQAGLRKKQMSNTNIGHYVGFGNVEWQHAQQMNVQAEGTAAFQATGSAASVVAGRLNFALNM